jgi:hypothetical protein
MPGAFKVKARLGAKVERSRHASLAEAIDAIASRVDGVERRGTARGIAQTYEPSRQVAGRFQIAGPGVRGGLDVRGDGSAEAYRGSLRKRLVDRRDGESPVEALRRALSAA